MATNTSHLTILTGASRGMGLAMAQQLLDAGHELLCISRKTNEALAEHAKARGARLEQWPHDLARGDAAAAKLAQALRVGLEAPMLLTGAFLRATTTWRCERKVLNISSGLGRRPMASQAAYCASKAGMDHFTRCVALEEALRFNGAKVCSLAPGVIDTDMQVQLRSADPDRFPDIGNFQGMKSQGMLTSPADAATRVLALLARADFGANPVADVRG
jgi:benzil reductase ((S)-benzoin forming)